jgi:rSAM/selenodomain-associated transferase 2
VVSPAGAAAGEGLSVIVPVLNEAAHLVPFLLHLRARAPEAEIIVVDGGSSDASVALARDVGVRVIRAERGRPTQMNTAAAEATGGILWFLHADNEIPPHAVPALMDAVVAGSIGGCFRVQIADRRWIYRVHDGLAHWVGRALEARCGDHGIFCTRSAFDRVGGYPAVPLMEDVGFVRKLCREGGFAWLGDRLMLSKRRHEQVGPYRYTLACCATVAMYCLGVSPGVLARLYAGMVWDRGRRPLPAVEPSFYTGFRAPAVGR